MAKQGIRAQAENNQHEQNNEPIKGMLQNPEIDELRHYCATCCAGADAARLLLTNPVTTARSAKPPRAIKTIVSQFVMFQVIILSCIFFVLRLARNLPEFD